MGGVGHELLLLLDSRVQAVKGVVEHPPKLVEFALRTRFAYALLEVSVRNACGRAADGRYGLDGVSRDPPAPDKANHPDCESAGAQRPAEPVDAFQFRRDVSAHDAAQSRSRAAKHFPAVVQRSPLIGIAPLWHRQERDAVRQVR